MAEELGDLDELFRVHANLTTVLELAGRHEEAVEVATAGIAAAKDAGLEAVYGNVLRGNAADSLFLLGRWEEARAMSMTALEWLPAGVNFLNALVSLATVEIELSAGEAAGRLLGQTLLELEAVRDAQQAVPLHLAAASFALWRGDLADARRAAERGWTLVRETEDWMLAARTAAAAIEVEAATAAEAREQRDLAEAGDRPRTDPRADPGGRGDGQTPRRRPGPRVTPARRRMAGDRARPPAACRRSRRRRRHGRRSATPGRRCTSRTRPPVRAGARPRRCSAPARVAPAGPRPAMPLLEAVEIASSLGALPLLRELRELAGRALIPLPAEVDERLAGPDDRPRELVGVIGRPG